MAVPWLPSFGFWLIGTGFLVLLDPSRSRGGWGGGKERFPSVACWEDCHTRLLQRGTRELSLSEFYKMVVIILFEKGLEIFCWRWKCGLFWMVDSCFEPPRSHKMELLQSWDEEIIVLLGERILQSEKAEGRCLFIDQRQAEFYGCYCKRGT